MFNYLAITEIHKWSLYLGVKFDERSKQPSALFPIAMRRKTQLNWWCLLSVFSGRCWQLDAGIWNWSTLIVRGRRRRWQIYYKRSAAAPRNVRNVPKINANSRAGRGDGSEGEPSAGRGVSTHENIWMSSHMCSNIYIYYFQSTAQRSEVMSWEVDYNVFGIRNFLIRI